MMMMMMKDKRPEEKPVCLLISVVALTSLVFGCPRCTGNTPITIALRSSLPLRIRKRLTLEKKLCNITMYE